uniref:Uncharacterized protein n=1 Tax=Oryza punctata TaxID=4537 RepID=A0A0E0JFB5_ORYPU
MLASRIGEVGESPPRRSPCRRRGPPPSPALGARGLGGRDSSPSATTWRRLSPTRVRLLMLEREGTPVIRIHGSTAAAESRNPPPPLFSGQAHGGAPSLIAGRHTRAIPARARNTSSSAAPTVTRLGLTVVAR